MSEYRQFPLLFGQRLSGDALVFTRMVLDETLRLYPSSFALVRRTRADETIRGYRIPARHIVWTNIYAAHHDPAYWEQPEVFDPERFSPEHQAQGVREAYFPFGGGAAPVHRQ